MKLAGSGRKNHDFPIGRGPRIFDNRQLPVWNIQSRVSGRYRRSGALRAYEIGVVSVDVTQGAQDCQPPSSMNLIVTSGRFDVVLWRVWLRGMSDGVSMKS